MAISNVPFFTQGLYHNIQTIANADSTTVKTLTTSQTNGLRITSIWATSTDTSARDVIVYITISAVNYQITQISIPAGAGTTNSSPNINLLDNLNSTVWPFDACGNGYIDLPAGATLSVSVPVAVTSSKQINIGAMGEMF